jgi:phosphatidylinositol kinase/protein kinase (PI-3  family)
LPKTYFGVEWKEHLNKIKLHSPYSNIPSYKIRSFMVKSGDDLRQEYMAMQLIRLIHEIAIQENLKLWVRPYYVIPFNNDSGLIEFVDDTRTVSYLKEKSGEKSLKNIYKQIFGLNW